MLWSLGITCYKMAAKKPYYRNLFEELGVIRESVTQFSFGAPSLRVLAKLRPLLTEATRIRTETEETGQMFQYGALRGDPLFLQELTKFLTKQYNDPVCSDNLMCTRGATDGIHLAASLAFKPGDYVFVEDPTYFIALNIFSHDLNMNIVSVPMDEDNTVNVSAFDQMLTEYNEKLGKTNEERPYRAIFYTIPVFHNPTTSSLSPEKCGALITVLRKHNVLAICDDVYNLIHFGNSVSSPKRLFGYEKEMDSDCKGHVVSNGTFSKILGPGLRIGWIEGPKFIINKIIRSHFFISGGGQNQYTSAIIGTALQKGILSDYFKEIVEGLQSNMEVMCQALDQHMKPYVKYRKPKGGYFIWVEFIISVDIEGYRRYCIENHKVDFRPGSCFSINGRFKNCIRLSYAYVEKDEINAGIKELAIALENFLKK